MRCLCRGWVFCLALAIALVSAQSANALTRDDILFYAPLDGTLNATIARGGAAPVVPPGHATFVEGHTGQGLLVGDSGSDVAYATAGNMQLEAGSIAMWVKPTDWSIDTYMRFFFRVGEAPDARGADHGNFLWLYKYFNYSVFWLTQQNKPVRQVYIVAPRSGNRGGDVPFDWQPGRWSHLIASWSGNQMTLYIDGQYIDTVYTPTRNLVSALANRFDIGGTNLRGERGTADTVIDDVLVLRRPLDPSQAALLFEKGMAAFDGPPALPAPLLKVDAGFLPSAGKVLATTSLIGPSPDELHDLTLNYQILGTESDVPLLQGKAPFNQLRQSVSLDTADLPDAAYRLRMQLGHASNPSAQPLASAESHFTKSAAASWQGNSLGVLKSVPAPWVSLARQGHSVSCLGRTYKWGNSGFPEQITAQGQPLLARPIALHAVVNGEPCVLENGRVEWHDESGLVRRFTARGTLGGIGVVVNGRIEFDGFLWCRVSISSSGKAGAPVLSALSFELPLRAGAASLIYGRPPAPEPGRVQPFQGELTNAPVIWLGNEQVGLQWSTNNLRDWDLNAPDKMVQLTTGANEVVLHFNLVDHAIENSRVLEYTVGLQATPVKPLNAARRSWEMALDHINSGPGQTRRGWEFYWQQWNRVGKQPWGPYGYNVANPAILQDLANFKNPNVVPWLYWHSHAVWLGDLVLQTYGGEWGDTYNPDANQMSALPERQEIPSIRDYQVWRMRKTLNDNPELVRAIAGIYSDVSQATWDPDPQAPAAADGTQSQIFSILGTRQLQQRFYFMLKQFPDLLLSNHQSGDIQMSQLAFSDMMVAGEDLTENASLKKELGYYHVLTLDGMRAAYLGANYGIPIVFLPEIQRSVEGDKAAEARALGPEGIPAAEHLVGMLWVHDVIPWIAYVNPAPFEQAGRAKDAFGWDAQTKFSGYWEDGDLVHTTSDQPLVVTSVFTRPGRAMFVMMNNSDKDAQVVLKPNWGKLGLTAPGALVDAYAEQASGGSVTAVPLKNDNADFTVKARNFRALVAR